MRILNAVALALLIIGGLNWGLVGLFHFDLIAKLFGGEVGPRSSFSDFIYILVALAAIYGFYMFRPLMLGERDTAAADYRNMRR